MIQEYFHISFLFTHGTSPQHFRLPEIDNGIITDVKFIGRGCSVSQGAASMLTERVKGKTTEDVMKIGPEEVLTSIGLNLGPSREKCALLSLNALQKSVRKYRDGKNE